MAIFLVRKDSKICVIFMKHCRNYGGEDVCTYSKTAPSLTDKQAADKDRSRPLTLEALGNIVPFLQGLIVSKSLPFDFLPVFLWYCENGKFVKNKNEETNKQKTLTLQRVNYKGNAHLYTQLYDKMRNADRMFP